MAKETRQEKEMGLEVDDDGQERAWKMGSAHKVGGLGPSVNYGYFRARLGLVDSLKSKQM